MWCVEPPPLTARLESRSSCWRRLFTCATLVPKSPKPSRATAPLLCSLKRSCPPLAASRTKDSTVPEYSSFITAWRHGRKHYRRLQYIQVGPQLHSGCALLWRQTLGSTKSPQSTWPYKHNADRTSKHRDKCQAAGEMQATITVFELPPKESRRRKVSLPGMHTSYDWDRRAFRMSQD